MSYDQALYCSYIEIGNFHAISLTRIILSSLALIYWYSVRCKISPLLVAVQVFIKGCEIWLLPSWKAVSYNTEKMRWSTIQESVKPTVISLGFTELLMWGFESGGWVIPLGYPRLPPPYPFCQWGGGGRGENSRPWECPVLHCTGAGRDYIEKAECTEMDP